MNTIDKIAWIHIENRKVLFLRSRTKDIPYTPGGKREGNETDEEALVREIKEEANVDLKKDTIKYLNTFTAQAHGKPEGVMVEIKCYAAEFVGTITPSSEIEELQWITSKAFDRLSVTGKLIVTWLKERDLID